MKTPLTHHFRRYSRQGPSSPPLDCQENDDDEKIKLHDDLAERMQNPSLDKGDSLFPTADHAYVHLKLLHAFGTLKKRIVEHDGLFGLHDHDVFQGVKDSNNFSPSLQADLVAVLAEKRWAVFVVRSVDRFTTWWEAWRSITDAALLTVEVMRSPPGSETELDWQNGHGKRIALSRINLPPLDVLLVWHAFMLNPRCYLEDCLRQDMMALWHTGMPWSAINASIDASTGSYDPGTETVKNYEIMTKARWSHLDDSPPKKHLPCPSCAKPIITSWSEVCRQQVNDWARTTTAGENFPEGEGYADPGFVAYCHSKSCRQSVSHDILRAKKFTRDCESWANASIDCHNNIDDLYCIPMPGTILDKHGCMSSAYHHSDPRIIPNHLITWMLRQNNSRQRWTSVTEVMDDIFKALEDPKLVMHANNSAWKLSTPIKARVSVRRMFSRYWDNESIFALDLIGAVIRQGTFIEKMEAIDWIHSPACIGTMARLAIKYKRFFAVMCSRIEHITVPTLDVDLLWHTNQLTPENYYRVCLDNTEPATFIDHDDKIGKAKLNDAFEETTKIYQNKFNEPYSECTCWSCETTRLTHEPELLYHLLHTSTPLQDAGNRMLYGFSGAPSDPSTSPHISSHIVINPNSTFDSMIGTAVAACNKRLLHLFGKTSKRASRSGKREPVAPACMPIGPAIPNSTDAVNTRFGEENVSDPTASGKALFFYTGIS